jgi:hypothetical protein
MTSVDTATVFIVDDEVAVSSEKRRLIKLLARVENEDYL